MDLDYILFLVAILNLGGDVINTYRFRNQIPRWMFPAALSTLLIAGSGWFLLPQQAGIFAISVFVLYAIGIRLATRKYGRLNSLPSPSTKILIGVNCAAFLIQLKYNATTNPLKLIQIGALYTPAFENGAWRTLFTAQFLHFGIIHLAFNMFGLWFLGPLVENVLGAWKFVLVYLISGTGGLLIAWFIHSLSPDAPPAILVGASANVLGLVGAQAAIALRAVRRYGSTMARAQLSAMLQIIGMQMLFDFMVPEVSSVAHLAGAGVGFVAGMILWGRSRQVPKDRWS